MGLGPPILALYRQLKAPRLQEYPAVEIDKHLGRRIVRKAKRSLGLPSILA